MKTPQECSQRGDAGNTSPRGIRNDVSRVSCHVACAIQILCHAIPSVRSALQKLAVLPNTGSFPELLLLAELIDFVRVENNNNNNNPWNPQRLYEYLQDAASIDYRNVGDATRSLSCLLRLLSQQDASWKELLEASVWEGETLQILEGRRAIDDVNTSQLLQRIKPATKNKPMSSPLVLKFCSQDSHNNNSWCLVKALEETVQPKTMQGSTYPWDSISPDTYTEQVITLPGDENHNNVNKDTNNNDGDDSNGDSDSNESGSDSDSDSDDSDTDESDSDSDSDDGNKWSTSKRLEIQRIPRVWLLHLDRPLVSINKLRKALSTMEPNQEEGHPAHFSLMDHVSIPLELNPSFIITKDDCTDQNSHGDEKSDKGQNQTLFLRGAIVQVAELDDTETEEDWEGGHSVTLLRDSIEDASWWLMDDDKTEKVSEEHATRMMGGVLEQGNHKSDAYFCASLLVYAVKDDGFHDNKPFENDILNSWNERNKQLASQLAAQQTLVGKRLKVKWAKGKFYAGNVTRYDASTGKHEVTYDDGDVKEYNLAKKTIEWID